MTINATRRQRQEDLRLATIKRRIAQWRARYIPCTCHACQLRNVIHAAIAAGQIVHMAPGATEAEPAHAGEGTKH